MPDTDKALRHQLMECAMVPVFFGCPAKHKAAVLPEPLQFRHVLAAELPGDNMDGEEKTVPFPFPVVLRIKPSAQHDDMDMGVEVHFRPPGMEEAEVTNLCTQVFWVCTKLVKGRRKQHDRAHHTRASGCCR